MESKKVFLVKTFCSTKEDGSPQYIHLYNDEKERKEGFEKLDISSDFDHSFIFIDGVVVTVNWKNKSGPIQFCGSGAYAIAWILAKKFHQKEIIIKSGKLELESILLEDDLVLKIPASIPEFVGKSNNKTIFYHRDSGIYLIQLHDLKALMTTKWQSICDSLEGEEIHGLCLFIWNEKISEGKLRYFTPWHGREEDHVTGSIHQVLTPLISNLYGIKKQSWTQLSALSGKLQTKYSKDNVFLKGNCLVQEDFQYPHH